ncbi:hypothetical protein FU398_09265 [Campylobacter jejuni]|nr:hypothetical protein [Campylobacter jejuni]
MNFDFNEARKNNSDEEILNSIKKKSKELGYDFSATEIIDALDLFQKQRKQNQQIEQNDDDYESNYSDPEIIKLFEDIKTNPEKQDFNQTSTLGQNSNDFINRENFSKSINSLIENIGGIKTGDQEIKINTQEQNLTDENSIQNPLKSQNTQTKSDFREDPKYKGVFYNDKEDTRLSDGFSWQGALNTLTQARDDYTYENKTDKAIYDRLRQNVRIKLQNKAPIEDYTNAEKEILLKDYPIDIKGLSTLSTLNSVLPTALTSQSDALVDASKIVGEKEQELVNKNLNDLSQEDKEYLKDKAGWLNSTWNKIFHDDDKTIEEEYDKLRGGKEIQEASAAVERLKNFSLDKNLLFAIVSGDKTKEKAKKRFEDDLTKTAEFLGFDNVAIDRINENIFFEKDNKLYKLNDGFFDNFETIMGANVFSIGGGIAGAIKGAKSGKDPKSKIIKGAGYGALGGLGGGGMDYLLQSYRDNKEARFDELVTHAMQEGLLSLVGDGVVLALKPLTSSMKPAMKLVQKAPIINYFTQDLPEQNVNAAKKVVNNWFEPKNREEAKKIIDEMGGGIELENGNFYGNKFVDWVKKKLGENSKTAKIAKHLSNFFMMPNARERQKEVFNLLRASDNGAAILAEVAKSDARAGEKLKEIFNYSTQNLKMQLGNLNLNKDEITDILKSYESGTSSDYARMEKVLSAAYKNEKVKLDHHVYEKVKNKLMDENLVGEEIDSFLKDLKSSLFDRELSFKQLNNARKNLNSLFSQRQNYGEYLKRVLANELRQTIQGGIEEIFSKNPKMFEKANKLYNDTLEEYGILKELQKMNFFKSAKDPEVNVKEIADKVLNAAKSQGDVLAKFTSKLDKKNQARIELNILDEIFNQSLYKNGKLEVFDSKNFFKRLENAKFHSKEANDYIQIAKNFDRVFGNDANIAGSIGGYKGVKLGTGLATSVEGAAKYQQTRILLNSIIRNLPNPLGLFNDLTGNAALRFHVLKALRKSQTSQEFTNLMEKEIKKMPFTSSSRINLSEFLKDFKELKNKVLEAEVIEDDPIYTKELNNPIIPHNRQVELKGVIDNFRRQSQNGKLPSSNNDSSENLIKSDLENSNANPQMNQDLINQSLKDIDFIDNKGEVRTLSKETQKEWLDTFSLKSLHESYIPNHNDEIKQALKGKEIKLTKGSLLKLVVRNRQKYIAYIKETLDNPDFILKDKNELIFAKNFNQETYFTSIGKNYDTHFTIVSNAPKKQNTIKNKLDNGAKILYQSSKFENLRYNQTFTDERLIANKTDGKNSTQDLINQSLNKFNIFDLYRSKNDFLDIKKLEKSLEKYKESKPQEIKYKTLKRGYILDDLLNVDEDVSYAVVNKDDLKPSLTRSLSQFRNKHSNSTISNIRNSFNEREHFKESSNFDGIPTITKDGLVIAGNHRTTAIKDLKGENLARYIKQAKRVYGEEVFKGFDENKAMIVRVLDKNDDDTIIRLSKLSNDGRLSDESEKLQALGAKYKEKLSNIENAKLNSEKELMNFLGSKDVLESRRALLDHLMPDIYNALLAWEKRSGGDSEFSKILSDNALNFLHLKQALNENKVFKDNGNDFFSLFKRAIESMNQSNAYKNSDELYEMLKKYAEPSLNFEKEFIPNDKDLQADILAFIVKYNDTLTNPSEALGLKIQKAIDFIRDNDSFSLFDEIKLSNYDVLNQMLNANIATGTKYQELLNKATSNISKTTDNKNVLEKLDKNIKSKKAEKSTKNEDDTLQRWDDYLGENKEFNLDYLDKMDLNPVHYNLTREFIINAKKDTLKGIKHDVPSGIRKQIEEKLNINPLKEFGENYTEYYHDGKGALQKLLTQKQGQVAGAFYRDDLAKATGTGEIDLVWGDSTKGLQHILERRAVDFEKQGLTKEQATQKALEFVENDLNNIITKGALELPLDKNGVLVENPQKMFFHLDNKKSVIAVDYQGDRKWVLTAYFKGGDDTPRSAYPHKSEAHGDDFSTSSSAVSSNETLPQNTTKSQADESQVLSAYGKNILENAPKETIEAHLKSIEKDNEIQITLPKEKQTRFTMRQNAYKSLKEVEKTPLTNANDGRVAYLNKTGRQESLSDYAINESAKNGFDEAQHLATAQHLPALFENAKFKETTRDLKNNDKNVKIHRYTANFLLDKEPAQAQITLKETITGQHSGNKIYTLKLKSVSRLSPAEPQNPREALSVINDPKSSGFGEPSTKPSEIVSKIQKKFKFGEKKAKDLYEWHKDSSPLTKNDDGTPKVFYHGSTAKFETFIPNPKSYGIWLTSDKDKAIPHYEKSRNELYSVFTKGKKFYIGDEKDIEKIGFLKEPYTPEAEKMFEKLKRAGYDGIDMSDKNILIVFDSNQIKSIDNAGSWTDSAGKITKEKPSDESARHSYFNAQSPNILHSNEIWGGGLAGGTLNGLETDEDGNVTGFDPAKFVAGFIAGAGGTFAFKKGAKFLKENPQFKEAVVNELKESLRHGWQGATKKYPILSQLTEPKYIIQNDKGRAMQARHLLNKLEKEQKGTL